MIILLLPPFIFKIKKLLELLKYIYTEYKSKNVDLLNHKQFKKK